MKLTLYNAISIDGFIADKNGNSSWVSPIDQENFDSAIQNAGNIIVGRKTFEQFENELFPIKNIKNFVFTKDPTFSRSNKDIYVINKTPGTFVLQMKEDGIENLLLIGGGKLNASFLKENLIDEIILVIHPIILGSGIKLFEDVDLNELKNLELRSSKELGGGLMQLKYEVKR
jgi:dihydrofolate reductase